MTKEQLVKSTSRIYGGTNACTSITVHETANIKRGADAQAHANLQTNGDVRQASWHLTADSKEVIRSFPDTAQCWHGGTKEANETSIAIEICVNEDGDYDKAFKNAAEEVRKLRVKHKLGRGAVKQHFDWSGKNCPAVMRLSQRWNEFLNLTDTKKEATPMTITMCSPFEGRLTSNHGDGGGYKGHRGMDIAPPKPGQTGMPIYAAFSGWIVRMERKAKAGNKNSTWARGRTGDGMAVRNKDGEGNGYNHMYPLAGLEIGDWVNVGDLIGHNNTSGNQTGPHLHFEMWSSYKDDYSDYDPQIVFKKHKIKPGSAPVRPGKLPVNQSAPSTVKPTASKPTVSKPKPSAPAKPKGYDPKVEAYQKRQVYYPGLKKDGIDGPANKKHKAWAVTLQNKLNGWLAVQRLGRLIPDGDFARLSGNAVSALKDDNYALYRRHGGNNTNPIPDRAFCAMLGVPHHPYG